MALAPPRKKKIIRVIYALAARVIAFLEATPPNETSTSESVLDQVAGWKSIMYSFDSDPMEGPKPMQDAWTAFENMDNELETGSPTEGELETLAGIWCEAMGNL